MAGATAVRSSIASSSETDNRPASFFSSALHRSHTCFSAAIPGSSFRPLGVESRWKATAASVCRAASQVWTWGQGVKGHRHLEKLLPVPPVQRLVPLGPGGGGPEQGPPMGPLPADGGQQLGGVGGVIKAALPAAPDGPVLRQPPAGSAWLWTLSYSSSTRAGQTAVVPSGPSVSASRPRPSSSWS